MYGKEHLEWQEADEWVRQIPEEMRYRVAKLIDEERIRRSDRELAARSLLGRSQAAMQNDAARNSIVASSRSHADWALGGLF